MPQTHATAPRAAAASTPRDLALVAVFAALIAVLSITPAIPLPIGVPITLQTLGIVLAGLVLGPVRALASVALWLAVGLVGLPVFSGGAAGVAVLAGPTVGYLLSFPLAAALAGALAPRTATGSRARAGLQHFLAGLAGLVVIHIGGIIGLMGVLQLGPGAAFLADLVYWPGDLAKNLVATAIALSVAAAFPRLRAR